MTRSTRPVMFGVGFVIVFTALNILFVLQDNQLGECNYEYSRDY